MRKVKISAIILFTALLATQAGYSQPYPEVIFDFSYILENCGSPTQLTINVSFGGHSNSKSIQANVSGNESLSITGLTSLTGPFTVIADAYCGSGGLHVNNSIQLDFSGEADCIQQAHFRSTGSAGRIDGLVKFVPVLKINAAGNECGRATLSTACPVSNISYQWEVTDDPSNPSHWHTIMGMSDQTIQVTPADVYFSGFTGSKYGTRYFRAIDPIYPARISSTRSLTFYAPGSELNVTGIVEPVCHSDSDGKIIIHLDNPVGAIRDFIVELSKYDEVHHTYQPIVPHPAGSVSGTSFNLTSLSKGTYRVKVINNSEPETYGTCSSTIGVEITEPAEVKITDFHINPVKCKGGSDGEIIIDAVEGGSATGYTFEWSHDAGLKTNQASNLHAGIYQIRSLDSKGCPSPSRSITVTEPDHSVSVELSNKDYRGFGVRCWNSMDGEITAATLYTTGIINYEWSRNGVDLPGETGIMINGMEEGTYAARITDGNLCTASSLPITIAAPPKIEFTMSQSIPINCAGDKNAGIDTGLNNESIIGSPEYKWSPGGENTPSLFGVGAGTYSVEVSDSEGCSVRGSIVIENPPLPSVNISAISDYNGSPLKCNGDNSGILSAVVVNEADPSMIPDYYSWYKDGNPLEEGIDLNQIAELNAGIYTLKIKYNTVCDATSTELSLDEPDPVSVLVAATSDYHGKQISCEGASDGWIQVSATGGTGHSYDFLWDDESTTATRSNITAGNYEVLATDINGCVGQLNTHLQDPEPVTVSVSILSDYNGQPISCYDAHDGRLRAAAAGGAGSFDYLWNTGDVGPDLFGASGEIYAVATTDINGCVGRAEQEIVPPDRVNVSFVSKSDFNSFGVSCSGEDDGAIEITGSGGTGKLEYSWSGRFERTSSLQQLTAGNYTGIVSDLNGCSNSISVDLSEPASLSVNVSDKKDISCFGGSDGRIAVEGMGGVRDYSFSLDGSSWQLSPVFDALGTQEKYVLSIKDTNGCMAALNVGLSSPDQLHVSFSDITPALCNEAVGAVTASGSGGVGGYQYKWQNGKGEMVGITQTISQRPADIYFVDVTDANSCSIRSSVGITSIDGPKIMLENVFGATCYEAADGSASVSVTGESAPFSYLWSTGETSPQAKDLRRGTYQIAVTDANACRVTETVDVPSPDALIDQLVTSISPACNGNCDGMLEVGAKGGTEPYTYDWNGKKESRTGGLCAGTYNLTVTDSNGCVVHDSFELREPDKIGINLVESVAPICAETCDGKLSISATGGTGQYSYEWSSGDQSAGIINLCAGVYNVNVSDGNGCGAAASFDIPQPRSPNLDLGGSVTLCTGQSYTLDAGEIWASYKWGSSTSVAGNSSQLMIDEAGTYWVEVTNNKGCAARDTFLLETSSDLLQASFLIPKEAYITDTVAIIDISWPLPERVEWVFPEEMKTVSDLGDVVFGRFDDPGTYEVNLTAYLGACVDQVGKFIAITDSIKSSDAGRLGYETVLKTFTVTPNPSHGRFTVEVKLIEAGPIALSVWNSPTGLMVAHHERDGAAAYLLEFDLSSLPSGTYVLRLECRHGRAYKRVLIR